MRKHYDVAVIGGGAGGLFFTALSADMHKELKFAIIEKNQRVGKKLLTTGNGRCNLTNIYAGKENYHGSFAPFMADVLNVCSAENVIEQFLKMGLITRVDEAGRVYPKSNQASTVLDVLRFNCEKDNVDIFCENKVIKAEKSKGIFTVTTERDVITADKLIFATGGAAAPKAGGDSSGYDILKSFSHSVGKLSPALCPINVKSDYLKALKGIRAQCEVSILSDGKTLANESGEVQFTENALSGICVFNLSQYVDKRFNQILRLRLLPEFDYIRIVDMLENNRKIYSRLDAENLMTGIFHKRLSQSLIKASGIKLNKTVSDISDREIKSLAKLVNCFDFEVMGLSDFNNAQVTKGGVKGDEVNHLTMESKITKGLYIIGEALDCNGDCGGYNLQLAFATGYIAAKSL